MRKVEQILSGLMLALTALLLLGALILGALCRAGHLSYAAALGFALLPVGLWLLWRRRGADPFAAKRLSDGRLCALLALVCLAVHLAGVLLLRLTPDNDYATFYATAADLALGRAPDSAAYVALFPHILGYAWVLSLVFRLFDVSPLTAAVFNALLTTGSGVLLYLLCLRWRGRGTAAAAFLLWIACPSKLLYNAMVLSEPWYSFLLLLFLSLVSRVEARPAALGRGKALYALAGIAGGVLLWLINAARPIGAILIIALVIWLPLLSGHLRAPRKALIAWALFLAALLLCYSAAGRLWNGWAERLLGEAPASAPGYNIYVGFNETSGGSFSEDDSALLMHYRYEVYGSAESAQRQMLEEAKARLRSGEIDFGRLLARKLQTFLGSDEGGAYYARAALSDRAYSFWAFGSNVYYYALLILALLALPRFQRESAGRALLLVPLYILGLTLAQMLVEVSSRYHYSLVPMFIILAAFSYGKAAEAAERS